MAAGWRGFVWLDKLQCYNAWCPQTTQCFRQKKQQCSNYGNFIQFDLEQQPKPFSNFVTLVWWFLIAVTCICMINDLDGSLSQIYDSVHLKRFQVLFIQSNVSQKGSWNRQTETGWTQHEASLRNFSFSCCTDRAGCVESQSKHSRHTYESVRFPLFDSTLFTHSLQRNKNRAAGQQLVALVSRAAFFSVQ